MAFILEDRTDEILIYDESNKTINYHYKTNISVRSKAGHVIITNNNGVEVFKEVPSNVLLPLHSDIKNLVEILHAWITNTALPLVVLTQSKMLDSDGITSVFANYLSADDGFMFTASPCGAAGLTVSVGLSDTTPDYGDVVTVTITSTGTPTNYRFWLPCVSGDYTLIEQASNTYAWTVDHVGAGTVYAGANEASATGYSIAGIAFTSTGYLLDGLSVKPNQACSTRLLSSNYLSLPIVNVVRDSDSLDADFTAAEITDGTLTTWTGAANGDITRAYDQTGLGHDWFQGTAAYQPRLVTAGTLNTNANGKPVALIRSAANGPRFYGYAQGTAGTVYAMYKPTGGAHAGQYYYIVSYGANPRIGMSDDLGTSTLASSSGAGSPTTKVNGAYLSPEQAGAMGLVTLNTECIVTIKDVDWSANTIWISGIPEMFEHCEVGTMIGDHITFTNNGTEKQAYIENEMHTYWGI